MVAGCRGSSFELGLSRSSERLQGHQVEKRRQRTAQVTNAGRSGGAETLLQALVVGRWQLAGGEVEVSGWVSLSEPWKS